MTLNKSVTKQHRLYLMYFLWNSNLLDKGFVSFFHEKDSEQYKEQFFDGLVGKLNKGEVQKFYNWLNDFLSSLKGLTIFHYTKDNKP